jgi:hypothetical protein
MRGAHRVLTRLTPGIGLGFAPAGLHSAPARLVPLSGRPRHCQSHWALGDISGRGRAHRGKANAP